MAKEVLDEVVEDGMSDYEKEEAVYKWMVKNIGHGRGGVISRPGMDRCLAHVLVGQGLLELIE